MSTLNVPIPQSSDNVAFEGGYDPANNRAAAKELDSSTVANSTTYGPQRVVVSGVAGYIAALSSPVQPTAAAANTDTSWSFAQKVNHVMIQNGSSANVPFELDAAATVGSPYLSPGQMILLDIKVTAVHFYAPVAIPINSTTTASTLNIRGWL